MALDPLHGRAHAGVVGERGVVPVGGGDAGGGSLAHQASDLGDGGRSGFTVGESEYFVDEWFFSHGDVL